MKAYFYIKDIFQEQGRENRGREKDRRKAKQARANKGREQDRRNR